MKKKTPIYIFILTCICFFNIYAVAQTSKEFSAMVNSHLELTVPVIQVDDLYKIKNNIVLLDARELKEYNVSHIEGALHIGYEKPDYSVLKKISKTQKIVIYCSIGYRSEKIGDKLIQLGYKNVYNLYGSIFEWVNKGYYIVDQKGKTSYNIHVYSKEWSKWLTNKKYTKITS